jgi:cytoskeletal protein CcmA (bactofilin family)
MVDKTRSVIVSDVKIKGNITEKESVIIDGEVEGDINAGFVDTFENSNIKGNIKSKKIVIGGKLKGNINSDSVHIKKTADVDGTIKQKTLSIEEGSLLTIKTEIKK